MQLIPASRSHWYAGIAEGKFPPPIKLTSGLLAGNIQIFRF
ncbi:AlpA family transcriptional regulator [Rhodoferax sp.]|nr:AlpA family phage regulatory protein [Rhodoferax sp.]